MNKTSGVLLFYLVLLLACQDKKRPSGETSKMTADTTAIAKPENFSNPYSAIDVSPMDMSYYPADYPKLKMTNSISGPPVMRIIYSRPHLQGRKLFHNLLKYGEPWRLGANEATEIQFYQDVTIQNKKIKAGRYLLYCIPQETAWTIVLNSNVDTWGLKIDSTKDLNRFEIPVTHNNLSLEYLTIVFEKTNQGAILLMAWADIKAELPVNF